jgi:hypothetical protein
MKLWFERPGVNASGICGTLPRCSIRIAESLREIRLQRTGGGKRVAANQFI